jgi:predicted ATP-grasp superfamily ATP-dependent carboligase
VPAWLSPATPEEAVEAAEDLGFPCVVKARRTYVRVGDRFRMRRHVVVRSRAEADAAVRELGRDGLMPVVEAFVPGRSLAVSAVVVDGRCVAGVAREALSFYPISGGTSGWRRTIEPDDVGVQEAFRLLEAVGYGGLGEVEYQVTDGRPYLMEIGVRAHGWVSLAAAAGVDLPLLAARAALGEPLASDGPLWRAGVEMRSISVELSRLREALDPRVDLPVPYSRRGVLAKAWPPWRPGMRYDHLDLDDPGPWVPGRLRRA